MKKTILFIDPKREYSVLAGEMDIAIKNVLRSGWYVLGRHLELFEKKFAKYCGAPYCVGVASGTEAIALALMAAGIGRKHEVITVANTAVPTAIGILQAGARPKFVDIDPQSLHIDPIEIIKNITSATRAILPVHLYGNPINMPRIISIAKNYGLEVIEDACQAHGAKWGKKTAGTFGSFGCYSFYPTKNLGAYGDGGAVLLRSKQNYERLLQLRNYGQKSRYVHARYGLNSRLDEVQAACLSVKLDHLNEWNKARKDMALQYREVLKEIKEITLQPDEPEQEHVYHLFVIRAKKRYHLQKYLDNKGIQTLIHYPTPIHLQRSFRALGYAAGSLQQTQKASKEVLSLPLYPFIKRSEVKRVACEIRAFYKNQ